MSTETPKYLAYNENFEITNAQSFESNNTIPFVAFDYLKPKYNPETKEMYEGATTEELAEMKAKKVAELRQEYSTKIDDLVAVYVQKKIIDNTEIPIEIITERDRLKSEYREKVNHL